MIINWIFWAIPPEYVRRYLTLLALILFIIPNYIFGIVWPILYLLMGITAWRTFYTIKKLFYVQLFFNAIWSWLFFSFHLPLISLIDIWLLIFINIKILFMGLKEDKLAAFLYTPYIVWLSFASYLNLFIVLNN